MRKWCLAVAAAIALCSTCSTVSSECGEASGKVRILPVSQVPDLFDYSDVKCTVSVGQDFQQVDPMEFLRESTQIKFSETHFNSGEVSLGYYLEAYNPDGRVSEVIVRYIMSAYCGDCSWLDLKKDGHFGHTFGDSQVWVTLSENKRYAQISIFGSGELGEDKLTCDYRLAEE